MKTAPIFNNFVTDQGGAITQALRSFASKFQTCIPAIVKEVVGRETVTVSPAVLQSDINNDPIPWADITTTVLTPYGAGCFISFPLAVGDTGWLVAADLDTSNFKQAMSPKQQSSFVRHQYQYGFFVPDAIHGFNVSHSDDGALVLGSSDGQTKIVLKQGEITVQSASNLKINAENVTITGGTDVTIDGISFKNHTHSGSTLTTTATVGSSSTPGVISGNTGVAQ